ncbi:glycosyltransferase [Acidobacteria bacterium AB60]|nr:glycosyltransferase [Acidobacteria bacterium AB60]
MMHVALMLPGLDVLGGAESQVLQLAFSLHKRGRRVTVIALSGTGDAAATELAKSGIDFLTLRMRKGLADPMGWFRLARWVHRHRPHILHAHLPHAAWMARWSRLLSPVPVVLDTIHNSAWTSVGRRLGYRCSDSLADAVTAVSPGAAQASIDAGVVLPERLMIIPNGIDTQHWRPSPHSERITLRARLGIRNEFLWLAAGRLESVKNFSSLLDAFVTLSPESRLVIAGTGRLADPLSAQIRRLGMDNRACLLGFRQDMLSWMQVADGFVLPSLGEGLPMVLLECGACALPAVATDVPGCQDVIVHGKTGLLASTPGSSALAHTMRTFMDLDPLTRQRMGADARMHIQSRFELETIVDQWEALYDRLIHSREPVAYVATLDSRARS